MAENQKREPISAPVFDSVYWRRLFLRPAGVDPLLDQGEFFRREIGEVLFALNRDYGAPGIVPGDDNCAIRATLHRVCICR